MDDLELTEIGMRAAKASPGPWGAGSNLGGVPNIVDIRRNKPVYFAVLHSDAPNPYPQMAADAEFIAHARTDVARLVDEVYRLRQEVDYLEGRAADLEWSLVLAQQ